jgi:hypothetical protein
MGIIEALGIIEAHQQRRRGLLLHHDSCLLEY